MLLVQSKNGGSENRRYIPPELCNMVGLTDDMVQDTTLMKNISQYTKLTPDDKVHSIDDILKLVNEKQGIVKTSKETKQLVTHKSSAEKMAEYGIEIVNTSDIFKGYSMAYPVIKARNDSKLTHLILGVINDISKTFEIIDAKQINYLCFYHKLYEKSAFDLKKTIEDASESYKIRIGTSEFVKMTSEDPNEWIKQITAKYANPYNLVLILLDDYLKYQGMYDPLKSHSLEIKGYPTQILLTNCLNNNRRKLSIVSNILLQVNTKLNGASYKVEFSKEIKDKNFMIVGVDSSGHKNESMSVAMCASIDSNFTKYTNKKFDKNNGQKGGLTLPISSFIYESLCEYFNVNKSLPSGVIIYRQGVSIEQKLQLNSEVSEINEMLNGTGNWDLLKENPIPYYYILVNKKSSMKVFEIEKSSSKFSNGTVNYSNPDCGLLVYEGLVDNNLFEFYVQPQKVVSGCASPTHFHVAYGNLKCPELVPKLTFDLCFLYSNWRGPVRVPAPLKYAEKLSKVLPKLHTKVKNLLCYV